MKLEVRKIPENEPETVEIRYHWITDEVREIIMMNRNGRKPESLKFEPEPTGPQFVSAVGDDAITRFDKQPRKKKNRSRGGKNGRRGSRPQGDKN